MSHEKFLKVNLNKSVDRFIYGYFVFPNTSSFLNIFIIIFSTRNTRKTIFIWYWQEILAPSL